MVRIFRGLNSSCRRGLCVGAIIVSGVILAGQASPSGAETSAAEKSAADQADSTPAGSKAQVQQALEELNSIVGGWRGVGQPVRNSTKGSWTETAEWVWEIKKDHVGLRYVVTDGKLLTSALLSYDPKHKVYTLDATLPDKTERHYTGTLDDNKLSLESAADDAEVVHQVLINRLNDKRTLVLFQTRKAGQERSMRVAEVGYTRQGTRLAIEGAGEPECIVTGGKGTSSTVYKGKTYYFCCSGCRDAFNDDPEGIIAEAARKAARKKKDES